MSFILVGFGVAVGLGVSSASPTWRDASVALALLSGLYLIIQAIISFGFGGYIAGRTTRPAPALATIEDDGERRDGLHGLTSWALAVLVGAALLALLGAAAIERSPLRSSAGAASSAEPMLSYETRQAVPRAASRSQHRSEGSTGRSRTHSDDVVQP